MPYENDFSPFFARITFSVAATPTKKNFKTKKEVFSHFLSV
jgi:hypothetical protein